MKWQAVRLDVERGQHTGLGCQVTTRITTPSGRGPVAPHAMGPPGKSLTVTRYPLASRRGVSLIVSVRATERRSATFYSGATGQRPDHRLHCLAVERPPGVGSQRAADFDLPDMQAAAETPFLPQHHRHYRTTPHPIPACHSCENYGLHNVRRQGSDTPFTNTMTDSLYGRTAAAGLSADSPPAATFAADKAPRTSTRSSLGRAVARIRRNPMQLEGLLLHCFIGDVARCARFGPPRPALCAWRIHASLA